MEPQVYTIAVDSSLLPWVWGIIAPVAAWFLGGWWKMHNMGAKSTDERWREVLENSRASEKLSDLSPQIKAYINEQLSKPAGK